MIDLDINSSKRILNRWFGENIIIDNKVKKRGKFTYYYDSYTYILYVDPNVFHNFKDHLFEFEYYETRDMIIEYIKNKHNIKVVYILCKSIKYLDY
jgi:hypothetical protein